MRKIDSMIDAVPLRRQGSGARPRAISLSPTLFEGLVRSVLVAVCLGIVSGCDTNDNSEDYVPAKVEFRTRFLGADAFSGRASAEQADGFGMGGAVKLDTLVFIRGRQYEAFVRVYNRSEKDITSDFQFRAESIQAFYDLQGLEGVTLTVLDQETDYNRNYTGGNLLVGLRFLVETHLGYRESSGNLHFRLVEFPDGVKNGDTADGGSTEVEFTMPLRVNALAGPSPLGKITRSVITVKTEAGTTYSLTASNPAGLDNGVLQADTLFLPNQHVYTGTITLFDDDAGTELTPMIRAEAAYYQFDPSVFLSMFTDLEKDGLGLPFGQTFIFDPGASRIQADSFIKLMVFDPNFGEEKPFGEPGRTIMEYRAVLWVGQ